MENELRTAKKLLEFWILSTNLAQIRGENEKIESLYLETMYFLLKKEQKYSKKLLID